MALVSLYDAPLQRQTGDEIVQSWDTAYKATELSDYSVCTTWAVRGNQHYLVHIFREKLDYPDLKKKVIEHAQIHQADVVIIENKGSGMSLIDDLRQGGTAGDPMPIAFDPENDKLTRMSTQSAKIEAGHVLLPRNAAWLDDFRTELLQFPNGRYDDQVDSLSQFLDWIHRRSKETPFSCTWIDPRPMPGDWPSVYADEASPARPGHPTVLISQRRNGRTILISQQEYVKETEAETNKARGEHDDDGERG